MFDEEFVFSACFFALAFAVIFAIGALFSNWACNSKWERSGFESDWGPIQGCMIRVHGNKWIPEERYRELDQ